MSLASVGSWSLGSTVHKFLESLPANYSTSGFELNDSSEFDLDVNYGDNVVAPLMAPAPPYRRSISKERFPSLYTTLRTQVYNDPAGRGPGSALRSIAWSPTGTLIATGSASRVLRVWNPEKASVKNSTELKGHNGGIECVAWNPIVEAQLASCSTDGTVRFWDVRSNASIAEVKIGGEGLTLAWAPDGDVLMVGRKDDSLVPIFTSTMTASEPLQQPIQTNQTTFSHSGQELFLTTGDGRVKIVDYPAMSTLHTLYAHTSACCAIELCPRGKNLAVGGSDALISLWDTTDWVCRHTLGEGIGPIRSVGFSFDGSFVAGGSDEGNGIGIVSQFLNRKKKRGRNIRSDS
ncbi:MAG: hypothetical protein M1812_005333 [Candelaria pacifica]|nr:MAG: hypothetical protein M1812_005333 [Candelaria pacifica]